jgi:hypothetical protein
MLSYRTLAMTIIVAATGYVLAPAPAAAALPHTDAIRASTAGGDELLLLARHGAPEKGDDKGGLRGDKGKDDKGGKHGKGKDDKGGKHDKGKDDKGGKHGGGKGRGGHDDGPNHR